MSKEINNFILAVIFLILGWVMLVPAFEFPDEQAHLGSVSYLTDHGSMPSYDKPDLTREMAESQKILGIFRDGQGNNLYTYHPEYHVEYNQSLIGIREPEIKSLNNQESRSTYVGSEAAKYPPLYYSFTSLFMGLVNGHDLLTRLYVARLAGLLIVAALAMVTWKIGYLLFKKKVYAHTLTLLVMLQPMMSFVSAGVNSDNLHNLWFTLILFVCLRMIQLGIRLKDLIFLGIIIALDIYTKPQGFIALPIIGIAIIISIFRYKQWKMLSWITVIGVMAFIVSGSQWEAYKGLFSVGNSYGTTFTDYLRFSVNKLLAQNLVWYWGVFKWLGVVLPPLYWRVMNRVVLLSLLGIFLYWWGVIHYRKLKKVDRSQKIIADPYAVLFLLLTSLIYALIIFWYDWQHTKANGYSLGIQARYFFPTIVAHLGILMTGILSIGWNGRTRKLLRRALILLFTWLQLGGIWRIISIYYPGQSLTELMIQASQYKPDFAKGDWWYLWGALYLIGLLYLIKTSLSLGKSGVKQPGRM